MARWNCYVVYKGKVPGVYNEWHECQAQVNGFTGASHKGFKSRQEGEASYLRFTLARERTRNRHLLHRSALTHSDSTSCVYLCLDGWRCCSCKYSRLACIAIFEMMTRYHFVLDDDYDETICMYMLWLHLWSRRHLYVYHDDICMC